MRKIQPGMIGRINPAMPMRVRAIPRKSLAIFLNGIVPGNPLHFQCIIQFGAGSLTRAGKLRRKAFGSWWEYQNRVAPINQQNY